MRHPGLRTVLSAGLVLALRCLPGYAQGDAAGTVAEQYLLAAANQERAALGLGVLHRDPLLAKAAAQHARAMAAHGTISHQFAGEPELSARGQSAGVRFSVISENVGEAPSAPVIHDMWMHSEGHRANPAGCGDRLGGDQRDCAEWRAVRGRGFCEDGADAEPGGPGRDGGGAGGDVRCGGDGGRRGSECGSTDVRDGEWIRGCAAALVCDAVFGRTA